MAKKHVTAKWKRHFPKWAKQYSTDWYVREFQRLNNDPKLTTWEFTYLRSK